MSMDRNESCLDLNFLLRIHKELDKLIDDVAQKNENYEGKANIYVLVLKCL